MLWYMFLLTVTLLSFSSILYGSFRQVLYNDLDGLLSSKAEGIANSIRAYWSAQSAPPEGPAAQGGSFASLAGEWVESKRRDQQVAGVFVRILDAKGEIFIASRNTPQIAPLPKGSVEDVLDGDESFDMIGGKSSEGRKDRFRTYTMPVVKDGKVAYMVQVGSSTGLLSLAMHNLVCILFLLLPLTVFFAGIPGVVLARLTLKPVNEMIDTMRRTTAENLKLKIHLPDTKDEIRRLADTLNGMTERLDRSFSSQQSFIRDLSGELRAPLRALEEDLGSALEKQLPNEERETILRRALAGLERFGTVIDELETLAKFDNDRLALEIRKVSLPMIIDGVLKGARPRAEAKDIDIASVLRDEVVIDADARQLIRCFESIVDNAIKYTNRKGRITVSAKKDRSRAVVTVADTGIGIEDCELPYIFDRFYQANKSRVTDGSFGLGLSIAKSVVDVHRGSILVDSKVGQGSVFTVSLPLSYPG